MGGAGCEGVGLLRTDRGFLAQAEYIPLRLDEHERALLGLLNNALNVLLTDVLPPQRCVGTPRPS